MRSLSRPRARSLSLLILVAALSAACGGDSTAPEDTGLTISDLVGSWTASSLVFTNTANPSETFDIIAAGGDLSTTILSGGRARTWLTLGDFSDEWDALLTLNGDQLTSTPAESTRPTRQYTVSMVGEQLTLTSTSSSFDFTLSDAEPVPATEVTVFVRN